MSYPEWSEFDSEYYGSQEYWDEEKDYREYYEGRDWDFDNDDYDCDEYYEDEYDEEDELDHSDYNYPEL